MFIRVQSFEYNDFPIFKKNKQINELLRDFKYSESFFFNL